MFNDVSCSLIFTRYKLTFITLKNNPMKSIFLKWTLFVPLLFLAVSHNALAVTFKIATLSPEGSFWMQKLREGGDEIAKKN